MNVLPLRVDSVGKVLDLCKELVGQALGTEIIEVLIKNRIIDGIEIIKRSNRMMNANVLRSKHRRADVIERVLCSLDSDDLWITLVFCALLLLALWCHENVSLRIKKIVVAKRYITV